MGGFSQGYSSILTQQLESGSNSELIISANELSWIASIFTIGSIIGSLSAGVFMDLYGRKTTLQLSFILTIAGWTSIALAGSSALIMCVGRVANGLAAGIVPTVLVYIGEVATSKIRMTFSSLTTTLVILGTLLCYLMGSYLSLQCIAVVYIILSVANLLITLLAPETPTWYLKVGKTCKARDTLKWLREGGSSLEEVENELVEIQNTLKAKTEVMGEGTSFVQNFSETRAWKPFLILITYFMMQQFSGYNVLLYYNIDFYKILDLPIDPFVPSAGYGFCSMLSTLFYVFLVSRFRRRVLSLISATGMAVTYLAAALYEYQYAGQPEKPFYWFVIICTWVCVSFGMIGMNALPWLMIVELIPARVRGVLSGVVFMITFSCLFVLVKVFPLIGPYLSGHLLLASMGSVAALGIPFTIWILPETQGKSLAEIEQLW